jgi:hypothetical protein
MKAKEKWHVIAISTRSGNEYRSRVVYYTCHVDKRVLAATVMKLVLSTCLSLACSANAISWIGSDSNDVQGLDQSEIEALFLNSGASSFYRIYVSLWHSQWPMTDVRRCARSIRT